MAANLSTDVRKYILTLIQQELAAGNDKLPKEREIAACHGASYGTVRLVTQQLEQEGFIRKVRGSGTYIRPEAANLLRQSSWRKLWYFHSPLAAEGCVSDKEINYGYFLLSKIRVLAEERNWNLQEVTVRTHEEFLSGLRRNFSAGDAILYLPPTEPFTTRQLGELARYASVPLVVIDTEFGDVSISHVTTDNRFGGMMAARHLLERGFKKMTVVLSEPNLCQQRSRLQGFRELADLAGTAVEVIDCSVAVNDDRTERVYKTLYDRFSTGNIPGAVFVTSDAGALGIYKLCREFGFTPGKEFALISFDGVPGVKKLTPALTTVAQPVQDICRKAFDILENWQQGSHPQHQLYPVLYQGESCTLTTEQPLSGKPLQPIQNLIYRSPEK